LARFQEATPVPTAGRRFGSLASRYNRATFIERNEMPLTPHDLEQISTLTLAHYNQRAEAFREATQDHDVRQNIDALLRHLPGQPPFTILDFGCGPGRDLKVFASLGHRPIGLDGAERFVRMAREQSGCEVWQQDFLKLDLPAAKFCGIFANASLFHVPSRQLPGVLRQLHGTLKSGGALFCSNPRGDNVEGWNGDRYGERYSVFHGLERWREYLTAAGFIELEHYYRPAGLPREQQPWLASVWRKPASDATASAAATKVLVRRAGDRENTSTKPSKEST
jgi:SAM-dependent methyltransferase